jgi:zinc transporter 2
MVEQAEAEINNDLVILNMKNPTPMMITTLADEESPIRSTKMMLLQSDDRPIPLFERKRLE